MRVGDSFLTTFCVLQLIYNALDLVHNIQLTHAHLRKYERCIKAEKAQTVSKCNIKVKCHMCVMV